MDLVTLPRWWLSHMTLSKAAGLLQAPVTKCKVSEGVDLPSGLQE